MRYGLSLLTALAWAFWLGGLIAVFVLVTDLFKVDRPTALVAAPRMFVHFERFELLLATVALIATAIWRIREPRTSLSMLFLFLAIATVGCGEAPKPTKDAKDSTKKDAQDLWPQPLEFRPDFPERAPLPIRY